LLAGYERRLEAGNQGSNDLNSLNPRESFKSFNGNAKYGEGIQNTTVS
jgi:hypothetical protein